MLVDDKETSITFVINSYDIMAANITSFLRTTYRNQQNLDRMNRLAPEHVLGRIGTATEIAEAIAYLIEAKWTSGSILRVDGGLSLGKIKD